MKFRYSLITVFMIFIFLGCASYTTQVREVSESDIPIKIKELRNNLVENGVSGAWFDQQIMHKTFQLHANIGEYFQGAPEKQIAVNRKAKYFKKLGVYSKVKKGEIFIKKHHNILNKAEARHGIHKELIAAIIGVETNFADNKYRGKFYAFNALVSQYIFTDREDFAVREITALYELSRKTEHPTQYYKSSYAGAIGWGQFIPSSLLAYFVNRNGKKHCINPFSIEDTVFSVENYFYKHKLSKANINDDDSRYRAVFAYNHSNDYVEAVLHIYDSLRDSFSAKRKDIGEES